MDDIVERLRRRAESWEHDGELAPDCVDAQWDREGADEIERLRALIVEWDDANNFGSLHGDDLTAAVDRLNATEEALINEARRG